MNILYKEFKSIIDLLKAFPDEQTCINHLEQLRWNGLVISPFDGSSKVYKSTNNRYKCRNTNKYFNVRTGTIFEDTKLPLQKWFMALYLFSSHKKGISSHQLAKDIDVTQKTAWFVLHRLRYAFEHPTFKQTIGGSGTTVEIDETYVGGKEHNKHTKHKQNAVGRGVDKTPVLGMIERDGNVRTVLLNNVKGRSLMSEIFKTVDSGTRVVTDHYNAYYMLRAKYEHEKVNHSKGEYVRGEIHTNTVEGYFSTLKRGIIGIYHYISKEHLQAYLDEFSLRYNTRKSSTSARFNMILANVTDRRLTYQKLISK